MAKKKNKRKLLSRPAVRSGAAAATATVVIAIFVVLTYFKNESAVVVPRRPSDEEVKVQINRKVEDYDLYLSRIEKATYESFQQRLNELGRRGFTDPRGGMAAKALDEEVNRASDSLEATWRRLERDVQDVLFSAEFRQKNIRDVDFLTTEARLIDSLRQETDSVTARIKTRADEILDR